MNINILHNRGVLAIVALFAILVLAFQGMVQVQAANSHSIDLEATSSQYLSISDASQTGLDITGDITMEAWVKFESLPTGQRYIVSKWGSDTDDRSYAMYVDYVSSEYRLYGIFSDDGAALGGKYAVLNSLSTGAWHHFAVTKTGTDVHIYVDGTDMSLTSLNTTPSTIYSGDGAVGVGALVIGTPNMFWDGLIDDVRVWNVVRTQTEIVDDKSRELFGNETGLVAYWKLNNSLVDETSNGNDLTSNGSPSSSVDTPFSSSVESLKVRKSSNESVTNSTVLQNDDDLVLTLDANKTYIIDGVIFASSTSATPDLAVAFFGQSGSDVRIGYTNDVNELVLFSGDQSNRIQLPANTPTSVHIKGTVTTGSSSGDFQLKWAQFSANAAATTVMEGSYLRAEAI